jgi:hypothetical protein
MVIHNPILTGSFTVNNIDVSSITSSAANITALNAATASLNSFSASVLTYTASQNILNGTYTLTSSFAAQTASFTAFTASILAQTASLNSFSASVLSYTSSLNNKTASFATTGSNTFIGTQTISGSVLQSGSFTSTGTLTAQTLVVQTITSSVDFVTGSTRFGSISANTHVFTGSVSMTGSLAVVTNGTEFQVTSTGVNFGNVIGDTHSITGSIGVSGSATFVSSITANGGFMSLGDDGTYGSTYKTLGLTGTTNGSHRIFAGTADDIYIAAATARGIYFWTDGATTTRMRILANGNVGIGTSSPAQTLEVNGNILASSTGKIGFRYSSGDGNYYSYIRSATAGGVGPIVIGGGFESGGGGNEAIRLVTNANPGERTVLSINNAGTSTFSGGVVADNFNSVNGLSSTYSLGTIAQNATITQSIPKSGFWIITNGGNNSGLIMITRAGGSLGVQLIFSTNGNGDVVVGTTSEPSGGNYLRLWMSAVGVLSIKNVNAYTGPYYMTSITTY